MYQFQSIIVQVYRMKRLVDDNYWYKVHVIAIVGIVRFATVD